MPMAFFPLLQEQSTSSDSDSDESKFIQAIEVRSTAGPETVAAEVRHALADIDGGLPVLHISTLSENIDLMLNQENVIASLALFFGLAALTLSCLGLYGLMAYAVQRRTGEMGIRMALGASRAAVVGMVLREALVQGLIGVAIGIPAAFATLRLLANQLYGVSPNDPKYSVAAALVLLLCMTLAAYLPAHRASRVDPLIALKYE